jgi:hypothetical protein
MPAIPHMTKIAKSVSPFAISFFKGIDRLSEQDGGSGITDWHFYQMQRIGSIIPHILQENDRGCLFREAER